MEPRTDNAFALVMPYADTAAMQAFLDRFAETIADDEHAVMALDQAGWHGSNALAVPANVTLVPLPAYSPELNPVERVYQLAPTLENGDVVILDHLSSHKRQRALPQQGGLRAILRLVRGR
ncbi:MAG: transposase [Rhodomicrobium sp.]